MKWGLSFLMVLFSISAKSQTLCRVYNNKAYGYVDIKGKLIVEYKYDIAFTDTIKSIGFVATQKGKIVCINNQGKELFNVFRFDNGPDEISEGLFRIEADNGKIGFADTKGNIIIPPVFSFAYPFHNGMAKVTFSGGKIAEYEHYVWVSDKWFYIVRK